MKTRNRGQWMSVLLTAVLITGVICEPMASEVSSKEGSSGESVQTTEAASAQQRGGDYSVGFGEDPLFVSGEPQVQPDAGQGFSDVSVEKQVLPAKELQKNGKNEQTAGTAKGQITEQTVGTAKEPGTEQAAGTAKEPTTEQTAGTATEQTTEQTVGAATEPATEQAKELTTEQAAELTTERAAELTTEEAAQETASEKVPEAAEDAGEDPEEKSGEEDAPLSVPAVSISEDQEGAYVFFSYDAGSVPADLTFTLTDSAGAAVGSPLVLASVTGAISLKNYFLSLAENTYGLSLGDMGKTVRVQVTVSTAAGEGEEASSQTVVSEGAVTLRTPEMSVPAVIGSTAVSVVSDLMDVSRISGLSYDPGSFSTERIVEKIVSGAWTAMNAGNPFTGADRGTYRVRIRTVLGDYYSNEFRVAVPAVALDVSGEQRIGVNLTAVVKGGGDAEPDPVSYEWFFGENGKTVCTEQAYTAALKDAVEAQTLTLTLRITDALGNKYTKAMALAPLDLSKAELSAKDYVGLVYNGASQIPLDAKVMLGSYVIPATLYLTAPAEGKNTENAGTAWMKVSANSSYLTGSADVAYVIEKDDQEIEKEDFTVFFTYDGKAHQPLLSSEIDTAGEITYKKWRKKNSSGDWEKIKKAPTEPGTYRVTVTVAGKGDNYNPFVQKKLVFTISPKTSPETEAQPSKKPASGSKNVPQPQQSDLTVTDANGAAAGYGTNTIVLAGTEENPADYILEIKAEPVKNENGTDRTNANGDPVYAERNLHVPSGLAGALRGKGCSKIRFTVGHAAVQVDFSAVAGSSAVKVMLAPLREEELTDGEKKVLEQYDPSTQLYALRIFRESSGADITEELAKSGALEVMLDITSGSQTMDAKILFLTEKREENPADLEEAFIESMTVMEKGGTYLKGSAPGRGVFGLKGLGKVTD